MIDDEELRAVFKIASEEHLQNLDDGLLHLEKHPDDRATLEALMREAHSLKGDANMLGVKDVGTLAHQFEDLLGAIKRGEVVFASSVSDRLYKGLDAIRQCVQEAVTGTPAGVNLFNAVASLMGAEEVKGEAGGAEEAEEAVGAEEAGEAAGEEGAGEVEAMGQWEGEAQSLSLTQNSELSSVAARKASSRQETRSGSEGSSTTQNSSLETHHSSLITHHSSLITQNSSPYSPLPTPHSLPPTPSTDRITTIRVETQKLDALMTQIGELTVTKTRLDRRPLEVEQLLALWEDWSRDAFKHRSSVSELTHANNGRLAQVQSYHQRHQARLEQLGQLLNRLRNATYDDRSRLETVTTELEENIRTLRLLPLSTIFQRFPRMVRDLAQAQAKSIELVLEGGDTRADKRILEEMKDPLMHLIRNAIDHGIEPPEERECLGKPPTATLFLRGYQTATSIVIEVADDGRGLDLDAIRRTALQRGLCRPEDLAAMSDRQLQSLIFTPGFSTRSFITEISGRGVGLDVVRTNVENLKGTLQVESTPGAGSTFRMQLRTTLATAHVLTVLVDNIFYAIPVEFVETTLLVPQNAIFTIKGRDSILLAEQPISIAKLADLLELTSPTPHPSLSTPHALPCLILKAGDDRLGLLVDALVNEQDVVLKPQSKLLQRVRNVSGATILGTGEVCMVLNPQDLIKSVQKQVGIMLPQTTLQPTVQAATQKQVILLAEDSIAIRTQEKRILESAGYEVVIAVDGQDALNKLPTRVFDAIVSDVQMPNLDGLSLTAKVRQHKEYSELPIILVTSLASDEDKRRGADAGANAYITKGTFDQTILLETLRRLV